MNSFWIKFFYSPIINRSVYGVLRGRLRDRQDPTVGRFTSSEIKTYLKQVWKDFEHFASSVPREATLGARINIQFACLTLSLFEFFLSKGIKREYAIELVADITWKVYRQWGGLVFFIVRILTRDKVKRLQMGVNSFLKFPFSPPAYEFVRLPSKDGVALDIRRCPIAEFFKTNRATDLCSESWCNLDFALAEMWGGKLERQSTLAAGCDRCDFRFKAT